MTVIENNSPKEFFEGPYEVSDLIPFTFPYADRTDVKVKIGDELATYGEEYEVSAESPSSILVKVNIDDGVQVTVYRETPIDQQSSYPQNSKFRSEQVESDLDKVCMIQQEQKETLIRCLRVPVENIAAFDGELPSPQEGKILVWSDEGKIVNSPSTITEIEDSVNTAVSKANTALATATTALDTSNSAMASATEATSVAGSAWASATQATLVSGSAMASATTALESATYASNKVDSLGNDIAAVISAAEKINQLEGAVTTCTSAATTATNKANDAINAANRAEAVIPTQTGQNGKFLKTNGTSTSWETIPASDTLPSQTGHSGEFLTTDGTDASWANVDALPSQTGQAGKYLTTDGTDASWGELLTRNIGEIVSSTLPLTDAGLHLLDGTLIQGSGSYSAFVDYIAGLVSDYPALFATEANWQTAVATYGVCSKFVYDSVNNTVRLPKWGSQAITKTSSITTASTVPVVGDGKTLGLTNGSNEGTFYSCLNASILATSVDKSKVHGSLASSHTYNASNNIFGDFGVSTNSSNSGLIAKTSSLLNITNYPLDCYYYIVIATSTKTNIEVDIDEIATDLNNKADITAVDGQWVTATGGNLASGVTLPTTTSLEYSLASWLPDDNYNYEVLLSGAVNTGATSGNTSTLEVFSDIFAYAIYICQAQTRAASSVRAAGNIIIPIGTDRKVSVYYVSGNTGTFSLNARGYRRIGTNQ